MTRRYNAERDIDDDFLRIVESWITASGEVFVVLRYLAGAGSKDSALCQDSCSRMAEP